MLQRKYMKRPGEIFNIPSTGAIIAYNSLAYNLYLLDHNAEVQNFLINRLKKKDHFYTSVFSMNMFDISDRSFYAKSEFYTFSLKTSVRRSLWEGLSAI